MKYISITALAVGLSCAGAPYAANVHFKSGPTFFDNGLTLTAHGVLAGLGFQDIQVDMSATANPVATCTNPAGETKPPRQNPAQVAVSAVPQLIPAKEIKNGNTSFSVTTKAPDSPILGAPDCPNSQWTEAITDLAFTSAVIVVEQPVGNDVLTLSCTFAPQTINGLVAARTVTCH